VERVIVQGLAALRWAAWVWLAIVLVVTRHQLAHPAFAVTLAAAALVVTGTFTLVFRADPMRLVAWRAVALELVVGAALVFGDGVAAARGQAFATRQSLGSVWPLVGILSAGLVLGPVWGAGAGAIVGLARVGSVLVNHSEISSGARVLSLTNTVVFYALGGAVAGYVARLVRRAEREVFEVRAREEVARTLHDGVLQTLAIVERRTPDADLARLAREQERELREYLFGARATTAQDGLGPALRAAAGRFESRYGGRVDVNVADDVPTLNPERVEALAAAVGEALTNAGKHGHASRVVVFAEPSDDGGVFCSVSDDGGGFDTALVAQGIGLTRSVRDRVEDVGGRAEVRSQPGRGTEVCLWVP
jgi:signal transduction histidine kinase